MVRNGLIKAGVRNLKEFGYPDVSPETILTDVIYAMFFRSMLNDNRGHGVDSEIDQLVAEIDSNLEERPA